MNAFQIAEEKTTIANLRHCAKQYTDRDPTRAESLNKEAAAREAAVKAAAAALDPKPAPAK